MFLLDTFHDPLPFKLKEISPGLSGEYRLRLISSFHPTLSDDGLAGKCTFISLCFMIDSPWKNCHRPGDIVNITGIFLPKPFSGFKVRTARDILCRFTTHFACWS
jgi:hypothetical protein